MIDTGCTLQLHGNHVDQLRVNDFYVLYGTMAPVQCGDFAYRLAVPKCSAKAGIARMLAAGLPWDSTSVSHSSPRIAVAELFCGGMGGWSQACRFSKDFHVAMALGMDPLATKWFVRNNGGCHCLQGEFYEVDFQPGDFPVYTCDVADRAWYQTFLQRGCDMFTISFPCTPWSSMGSQTGLQKDPGRALLEVLKACSARRRWIAVAFNTLHLHKPQLVQQWARPLFCSPATFDPCKHTADFDDEEQAQLWVPTADELRILRQFPVKDGDHCPPSRSVLTGGILPTCTASYRKSLSFDPNFLERKGLHAFLVMDARQRVRWLTPIEAAVDMGSSPDVHLPSEAVLAVHLVGNAIAIPHAALALHYAAKMLNEQLQLQCATDFGSLLVEAGCQTVDLSGMCIVTDGDACLLCQKHVPRSKKPRMIHARPSVAPGLALPRPSASSSQESLASTIPDTLPFPNVLVGLRAEGPSGYMNGDSRFVAVHAPLQPVLWSRWLQGSPYAKNPEGYLVSFQGEYLKDGMLLVPGYQYTLQLHRAVPGGPGSVSGVYDLAGDFHPLPTPSVPIPWKQWLRDSNKPCPDSAWVTADGMVLGKHHVLLPNKSQILRLRARIRGGMKDVKGKLQQHLLSKGVASDAVQSRIDSILQYVSEDQLESAYRSLEPWAAIKNLIGNRMRLVTPEELRSKKKPNLPKQASSSDPWLVSDPWSEGRSRQPTQEEPSSDASIQLIPSFFECEDGSEPAIVPQIQRDVRGLCMLPFDQAAALSSMKTTISAGECAAVVLGTVQASLGSFPMEAITFPALHCDSGKILLKGVLINYGTKKITLRKSTNEFQLQPKSVQVLTFEIPKEFVSNWDLVLENPLKFIWRNVDKAQAKLLSTWSRKFFHNRAVVPPTSAFTALRRP